MRKPHAFLVASIFAVHASLGCGVHHACQNCLADTLLPASQSHRTCPHDHHGQSDQPAELPHTPHYLCQDIDCSFTKAEPLHVDLFNALCWRPAVVPSLDADFEVGYLLNETDSGPKTSSAQLYVWHCALLI